MPDEKVNPWPNTLRRIVIAIIVGGLMALDKVSESSGLAALSMLAGAVGLEKGLKLLSERKKRS